MHTFDALFSYFGRFSSCVPQREVYRKTSHLRQSDVAGLLLSSLARKNIRQSLVVGLLLSQPCKTVRWYRLVAVPSLEDNMTNCGASFHWPPPVWKMPCCQDGLYRAGNLRSSVASYTCFALNAMKLFLCCMSLINRLIYCIFRAQKLDRFSETETKQQLTGFRSQKTYEQVYLSLEM